MNESTLNTIKLELRDEQDNLLNKKGADYTRSDSDKLANFKRIGRELKVSPMLIWAVYVSKHWDAIMAFVTTGKLESENLKSRFVDLQNYATLGYALYLDMQGTKQSITLPMEGSFYGKQDKSA